MLARSVEAKKQRRKVYCSKKKAMIMKKDKYYDKLCEDGLKKRFKSIPVEDRLPVDVLKPDRTELSSRQDDASNTLSSNKQG